MLTRPMSKKGLLQFISFHKTEYHTHNDLKQRTLQQSMEEHVLGRFDGYYNTCTSWAQKLDRIIY
jgi:hypothetical protein